MTRPRFSSAQDLAEAASNDPTLEQELKTDPVGTLRQVAKPLDSDFVVYRIVVSALGLAVILSVLGAIALGWRDMGGTTVHEPPQLLTAIGSAAVGALAGLLAPSPSNRG